MAEHAVERAILTQQAERLSWRDDAERGAARVELTLLTVPDCPSKAAFEQHLAVALANYPDAVVRHRQVADDREAAEAGMHGSPTLLIDGVDPFAQPGQAPSMSCRLYRDSSGRLVGAPPVGALRQALAAASQRPRQAKSLAATCPRSCRRGETR